MKKNYESFRLNPQKETWLKFNTPVVMTATSTPAIVVLPTDLLKIYQTYSRLVCIEFQSDT